MTRARAACIVFDGNAHVLLMHRLRQGQQYYVVPGGGVETEETAPEACLRELFEETSLRATRLQLVSTDENDDGARTDYFLVEDAEGEPRIGGPEAQRNSPTNQYELRWVALHDLGIIPLRPDGAVAAITAAYARVQRSTGN